MPRYVVLHMLYYMNWLTYEFWTRTGGWESNRSHGAGTSSPSHWQQVEEQAPKPVDWMMCFLLITFVPVQKLCVNIYIYMHSLYEFCYRTYVYIQHECHSVLVKLHPITFYRTLFLESARFLGWMPLIVCFGLPIVSCSLINSLILGCLWLLVFVLNNTLILVICCSAISHVPGCFCPWTSFQNISFNMVPSDPFMSHLATQLILQGSFRLCNWLSLRRLVSWINHLPPACWKSIFKQQLGFRFDTMDSISSYFVFWHMQLYMSWYMSFFGFIFTS